MIRVFAALALFGLSLHAEPAEAQTSQRSVAANIAALRQHEQRLTMIGERLSAAAAAVGWCDPVPSLGWTLGHMASYPEQFRPLVRREWRLGRRTTLFVSSIAPDGPAGQAGIRIGMAVTSINGNAPQTYEDSIFTRQPLALSERLFDEAMERGPVIVETVLSEETVRRFSLSGRPVCHARLELSASDDEQAYTDGSLIQVTAAMAEYTKDNDDEFAAVIAQIIGQSILLNIACRTEGLTFQDCLANLSSDPSWNTRERVRADRFSVWLLAQAGYDPQAALTLRQRFGSNPDGKLSAGALPDTWRERVAAIEDELSVMRREKAADPDARPALLERARPPSVAPPSASVPQPDS